MTLVELAANGGGDKGVHGGKFRCRRKEFFIASYEFAILVDVKSADLSAQFEPAAAPPSQAVPGPAMHPFAPFKGSHSLLNQIYCCFQLAWAAVEIGCGGADGAVTSKRFQNMNCCALISKVC